MHIVLLTNEYPPHVYGGAGVHVEYLTRELARAEGGAHTVQVLCFGGQRQEHANLTVEGVAPEAEVVVSDPRHARLMDTLQRDLMMAGRVVRADVVHCHTWYSHFAGCLVQQLTGARLVLTTHSLEPHRPWKVEQLGTAYHASTWLERTAYQNADGVVAVSAAMQADVEALYGVDPARIRVIPNGIDPDEYRPRPDEGVLRRYDVDPAVPYVLFVGRITRQKGIVHLVRAIPHLPAGTQVVLAAGAPDTPEIEAEMTAAVAAVQGGPQRVVWIRQMLPRADAITLYTHAAVFVCPSVYEPFGIINLEAMACETAVVASAVGGIPSIVVDGETGHLVPFAARADGTGEPQDPAAFARALAEAAAAVLADPERAAAMGRAGRARVEERFSWRAVAAQTLDFYRALGTTAGAAASSPRPGGSG